MCGDNLIKQKSTFEVQPFLKWAGGKRWLVSKGLPVPENYNRLIEPFVGSGAVFFHLQPESALLCDVNGELINLYRMIRDFPSEMQTELEKHHTNHSKEYYYHIRSMHYDRNIDRAARMMYLNRTCWNGLYRVNRKGEFNVPIGTKTNVVMDGEKILDYSNILRHAKFKTQDFEKTVDNCIEGDFLFVDPPYTVKHNMNGFVKYNENIFVWDDQIRLVEALKRAASRGVYIVATNADHESIRDIYKDFFVYKSVRRSSVLAASSENRGHTTEALFVANLKFIDE